MDNITTKVTGTKITITIDVAKATRAPSSSGKTLRVASTQGNKAVQVKGVDIMLGINAYVYPDA